MCYAALPYLVDFEDGRSFGEAQGSPLFRAVLSQRATACDRGEIQRPFRSRILFVAFAEL